ncbi:glucokinase [Pilimelia terevasa]|uniref:Glucokinase n=1 Tax=Pilimelia terevasa TaxID=53372 RepID=A0A8J3BP50_9ACTN|nr:ROK family protein [Pilimelia terevasa]GGK33157.1 glucokinase [Pilimelia terevasa]
MTDRQPAPLVVGLDNGGTTNNATVLAGNRFLVDGMVETPSRVREGPEAAIAALAEAYEQILALAHLDRTQIAAVGLDTPGPADARGVISRKGSTNFAHPGWHGFDVRAALEERLGVPVTYHNDGNAAALYAHRTHLRERAGSASSVSVIVGTGLGGGIVVDGRVLTGAAGMAGELGHVPIPLDGLLDAGQPVPTCQCGTPGDAESVASLTAITGHLLPYWLTRYPDHPLHAEPADRAGRQVRGYGERQDPLALRIFAQQAMAIGRLLTIVANVLDPHVYLIGGGVVETAPAFRRWFLDQVRAHTALRAEQAAVAEFALVPDLDMAGARGAALAAAAAVPAG